MRQQLERLCIASVALISSFVLTVSLTASAHAGLPPRPGESRLASRAPTAFEQWVHAAYQVTARFRKESARDVSYAQVTMDVPNRRVLIHRKQNAVSPPKTSVASPLYSLSALPPGVNVEFKQAPMTKAETDQLTDTIWRQRKDLARQGIMIEAVNTSWTGPVTIEVRNLTERSTRKLKEKFSRYGPNTVRTKVAQKAVLLNRDFDVPPFIAGGHINSATGIDGLGRTTEVGCTSGFGGQSTTSGKFYLITADHCVQGKDPRFWTSNAMRNHGGLFIGTVSVRDPNHDIAFIKVGGPGRPEWTAPWTWDGPIFPKTGQFYKRVNHMITPVPGAPVCSSGSYTGARCYGTVEGTSRRTFIGEGGDWTLSREITSWAALKNDGKAFIGTGDSGGPIFTPNGDIVAAMGMISGGNGTVPCVGEARVCYLRAFFTDVYTEAFVKHHVDLTKPVNAPTP